MKMLLELQIFFGGEREKHFPDEAVRPAATKMNKSLIKIPEPGIEIKLNVSFEKKEIEEGNMSGTRHH